MLTMLDHMSLTCFSSSLSSLDSSSILAKIFEFSFITLSFFNSARLAKTRPTHFFQRFRTLSLLGIASSSEGGCLENVDRNSFFFSSMSVLLMCSRQMLFLSNISLALSMNLHEYFTLEFVPGISPRHLTSLPMTLKANFWSNLDGGLMLWSWLSVRMQMLVMSERAAKSWTKRM